jgi:hypothetical protein
MQSSSEPAPEAARLLTDFERGLSVLLLDAGPRFDPINDYPLTGSDWELRDFPEKSGSKLCHFRSRTKIDAHRAAHRIHPDAMKMKTRFGVAADWPIDYAELEPPLLRPPWRPAAASSATTAS